VFSSFKIKDTMDKIKHSTRNYTPYGGLNFIYQAMNRMGLDKFINEQIGYRSAWAQYSYAEIVYSLFGNVLTQGTFIADLEVFKDKYCGQVFNKIPSPDTVEYACQELKTPTLIKETGEGVIHQLNYDNKMNKTLVGLAVKTNQLNSEGEYTIDYDNVITENNKQDAEYTYKHNKGYHPGIAFIGRIPIHIENRNGNTPARYDQKEILQRCFDNLHTHNLLIKYFRGDAASYQKGVIEVAEKNARYFYIRMMDFEDIRECCGHVNNWQTVEINNERKEVASILYAPFHGDKQYRVVVTRKKRTDRQMDLLSGCAYTYQGIITNNEEDTEKEAIEFYNQRGDDENSNRYMLNDFNWHHLPFMDLDTNTVYMYLMAMCAILFEWVKKILVKNNVKGITLTMRIKAVCFHYITVVAIFIQHARQTTLNIFSLKHYTPLLI
jgi:hypothetical protein